MGEIDIVLDALRHALDQRGQLFLAEDEITAPIVELLGIHAHGVFATRANVLQHVLDDGRGALIFLCHAVGCFSQLEVSDCHCDSPKTAVIITLPCQLGPGACRYGMRQSRRCHQARRITGRKRYQAW